MIFSRTLQLSDTISLQLHISLPQCHLFKQYFVTPEMDQRKWNHFPMSWRTRALKFYYRPRKKLLVCTVSDNFKIHFCGIGSLNLIMDAVKLSFEPVFGCGVKHLGTNTRDCR